MRQAAAGACSFRLHLIITGHMTTCICLCEWLWDASVSLSEAELRGGWGVSPNMTLLHCPYEHTHTHQSHDEKQWKSEQAYDTKQDVSGCGCTSKMIPGFVFSLRLTHHTSYCYSCIINGCKVALYSCSDGQLASSIFCLSALISWATTKAVWAAPAVGIRNNEGACFHL